MSNAFCGIGQIPKGKKRGSMKECAELGQIRYYGLKKIDQRLVDNALSNKKLKGSNTNKLEEKSQELMLELATIGGKIKKLSGQIQAEKNKSEKEKLNKDLDKYKKRQEKLRQEFQKVKNEKEKKGSKGQKRPSGNKRSSKKGNRRGSKKGSRRGSRKHK